MTVTAPIDTAWKPVELFGGAIAAQFPERFGDISDVRPVPDHQEVSMICSGDSRTRNTVAFPSLLQGSQRVLCACPSSQATASSMLQANCLPLLSCCTLPGPCAGVG